MFGEGQAGLGVAGTLCLVFGCPLSTLHGTWHSADTNKRQLNQGKISLPIEEGANRQPRHRGTEELEVCAPWKEEGNGGARTMAALVSKPAVRRRHGSYSTPPPPGWGVPYPCGSERRRDGAGLHG